MTSRRRGWPTWATAVAGLVLAVAGAGAFYWRDDILRTGLDPKTPYQTYRPPPAPDYAERSAWARLPDAPISPPPLYPPADVFFVHPTTYDGGRHWNGPIDDAESRRLLEGEVLPNWAEPYRRVGRLFAPRYRQASLYARLTLRDDALEARAFPYADVRRAFRHYLDHWAGERPLVLAGVEQGATLVSRLATEAAADPRLRGRLVAVHLLQAPEPAASHGPASALPACDAPARIGCVLAYAAAPDFDLGAADRLFAKAVVWTPDGRLEPLGGREVLCVNPVTGDVRAPRAPETAARGAANATGLEPGLRPAFLPGQTATRCERGVLRHPAPRSPALRPPGGWAAGLRTPPYNLFYLDLEADAARRLEAWSARR